MGRATRLIIIAAGLLNVWPFLASAADPPAAPEDKQWNVRLGLFKRIAEQVTVYAETTGGKQAQPKMMTEPLYRYRQKTRSTPDAIVWGWTDGGRPAAICTLACTLDGDFRMLTYEFDRLSAKPLACEIDGQETWTPRGGLEMTAFPGAAAPADDAAARLKQATALVAKLKGSEVYNNAPPGQPPEGDLVWLPKPVHRYSDAKQGIIDGFLCLSCIDANPEVVLVLEAQRNDKGAPVWRYGFNRIAFAELHIFLDDKEIWTAPHLSGTSSDDAYHLKAVRLHR
jgi:hypothetical protein